MDNNRLAKLNLFKKNPELALFGEINQLNAEIEKVDKRLDGLDTKSLRTLKGEKGDKGDKGEKGDSIIGPRGFTGPQGMTGKDGKDGRDGLPGKDGKDGLPGKDGSSDTPKQIADKLNTLNGALEGKIIKNLPSVDDVISALKDPKNKNRLELRDIKNAPLNFNDMRWHGGGVTSFTQLTDVPQSYTGQSGKFLAVKATEDGLEFLPSSALIDWGAIGGTLSNQTDLQTALNGKQATLVSGTNIKTINSTSLLGVGDITINPFVDAPSDGSTYGRKNGAWSAVVSGTGDVVGPAGATSGNVVLFDGATGKLIKDGGTLGTAAFTNSTAYEVPLTFGSGLTRTVNAVANDLITGKTGGQTIIGGTAVGDYLIYKSTTGAGTATGIAHQFVGGTNGGTTAMTVLNNGFVGIGETAPLRKFIVRNDSASSATMMALYNANTTDTSADLTWGYRTDTTGAGASTFVSLASTRCVPVIHDHATRRGDLTFQTSNGGAESEKVRITGMGTVGIGVSSPGAVLHIKAGSDIANGAPLKLTSGTLTTGANITAGSIEFLTDAFYGTITTGPARKQFAFTSDLPTRSINSVAINTSAGSAASTDYIYLVSGTTAITLPTAVGNTNLYTVKRVGINTVTINTTGGQTIDGSATQTLLTQYESMSFISDNSNWNII